MFRAIWLAVLASNIGMWMQLVGAQWLLVNQPNAALLVALVQVADYLPDVTLGLVGGVLADIFDRRRLLIAVEAFLAATAAALTALTIAGQMPPALLLTLTFLLGTGSVIAVPAYQSLIPDLVPRTHIRAASSLSSLSVNIARVVGPAAAGLLIARLGVAAVFAVNATAYAVYALVMVASRLPSTPGPVATEPFLMALRAGGRYIRYAPVVRRILTRAALFLVPTSVLWALLPVVAVNLIHQGADGYGVLLAAIGLGAVGGAFGLPALRARFSINKILFLASAVQAAALSALVLIPHPVVAVLVLLPAGAAWIAVLSEVNAMLQLFLPAWVRARGLSVYQMVLFGSQGAGALIWGLVAGPAGLPATFVAAAILLVAGAATLKFWPFMDTSGMDREQVKAWPEPELAIDPATSAGPVLVLTTYTINPDKEERFLKAMARVRQSRLRTGAVRWGLFRDGARPDRFVELFSVLSWEEHLLQHQERQTGADRAFGEEADSLSDPEPETRHLNGASVPAAIYD